MSTEDYIPPPGELTFHPAPPPIDSMENDQTWVLEIGPGKGEFILQQARENPNTHFVAVELKRGRFEKISRKIDRMELDNLFLIRGDARECLPRLFPERVFHRIFILFPDPWPKKRHAKHRLLKPRLVGELHRLLKPGGNIISATDAGFYSEQIVASFHEGGRFSGRPTKSPYPTYFEQKWRSEGRNIDYWCFTPN